MRSLLFLFALTAVPLATAQSMNVDAEPASGVMSADSDDEARRDMVLRNVDLVPDTIQDDGCYGYVDASAPDVGLEWDGGDLQIRVEGDFDATLVVAQPDGTWACIDDSPGSVLPTLDLAGADAGRYAVWVGSFGEDPMTSTATVVAGPMPPPLALEAGATPLSGIINAPGGFEAGDGTLELAIQAGGSDAAGRLDPELFCAGHIDASQPTANVLYSASGGTGTLAIGAVTGASDDDMMMDDFTDLVLVVSGPDGQTYCNDDYAGPDPLVVIDSPESGTYAVWAGTYSLQDGMADATLTVAESAEDIGFGDFGDMGDFDDMGGFEFSPYSEGTYVLLDLEGVPGARLTGGDDLSDSVETTITPSTPNPVQGEACRGYIEGSATVAMELSGDGPFALRASGVETDLTMTVLTPSGMWFCSDDAEELDPGIQLDTAEDGLYRVWVGTFGDMGTSTDVSVSIAPGEVVSMSSFGGDDGRVTQTEGMYAGTEIQSGNGATELSLNGDIAGANQSVMAGGPVLNPVEGAACQGFVSERPVLSVFSSFNTLEFEASSGDGEDLTMVVLAPDGTWTCSDDADGSDPAVSVTGGEGEYSVWVGTFSRRMAQSPAMIDVTVATPPPPPPAPEVIRG
ncbi:hypothetical protein [Rubrivirga sp.]|uniref:hypothetical protein n=1 Tax=Rubrivirga sp. TaxID=1885344 RepID=UPI003C77F12B